MIAVSAKWWENFVGVNRGCLKLSSLKKEIHGTRTIANLFTTVTHVIFVIASMYFYEWQYSQNKNYDHYFNPSVPGIYAPNGNDSKNKYLEEISQCDGTSCADDYIYSYVPSLVCIGCSLGAYYFSGLACKLLMQRWSFALPLVGSIPIVLSLIFLQCNGVVPKVNEIFSF